MTTRSDQTYRHLRGHYQELGLTVAIVACHAVLSTAFIFAVQDYPWELLITALSLASGGLTRLLGVSHWLIPFLPIVIWMARGPDLQRRFAVAILQLLLCLLFMSFFAITKISLTGAMNFYLDEWLHRADSILHFGQSPVALTHAVLGFIPGYVANYIYITLWIIPATILPVVLSIYDRDASRRVRFLLLYFFVWIGLGNFIALAGMSAGPVFYDRLIGSDTYAYLPDLLRMAGFQGTQIAELQDKLWALYIQDKAIIGSGISAFPSVHVGISAIVGLYLIECNRRLLPLGIAIPVVYLVLSVYTGWHYAIDGYFSIAAVVLVWFGLRRWMSSRQRGGEAFVGQPAPEGSATLDPAE